MYRIMLCEDDEIFSQAQEKICRDILERLNIKYDITVFSSSTNFLHAFLEQKLRYDLILLDIMMDGIDGITLARQIRSVDKDVAIIFITSTPNYVFHGYDVHALHYLMKPLDAGALAQLIAADYSSRIKSDYILLRSDTGKIQIAVKDIICAETAGRRVKVSFHLNQKVYYDGTLTGLLNELPKELFIQCHKSYAVNIQSVHELTQRDIITLNGLKIPVSRTFAKEVQQAFLQRLRKL
jgi:Response regulator of the LytR/AlgR family